MKISVFGSTGGTGRENVRQALAVDTDITILVRDPGRLSAKAKGANIVIGFERHGSFISGRPL